MHKNSCSQMHLGEKTTVLLLFVQGTPGMRLEMSPCEGIWGVCNSSGLKHSVAFCRFAWFLMVFLHTVSTFLQINSAACLSFAVNGFTRKIGRF